MSAASSMTLDRLDYHGLNDHGSCPSKSFHTPSLDPSRNRHQDPREALANLIDSISNTDYNSSMMQADIPI